MMTSTGRARLESGSEVNPKIDPALNSNTEKEPDDWVSDDDPMTGAQAPTSKPCQRNAASRTVFGQTSPNLKLQNG
jgi:Protein of unknown function (DUF3072)